MIAAMTAMLVASLVGAPLARRLDPDAPLSRWIGEAFLVGVGIVAFVLLALTVAGVRWSLGIVLAVAFAVALAPHPRFAVPSPRLRGEGVRRMGEGRLARILDFFTAVALFAYARYATAASPWESDFIAIWGLKGRVFAQYGGIDFSFLRNPWYGWSHPDYPPLVPLTFDFMSLFARRWDDRWLGIFYVAAAVAATLIVRALGSFSALVLAWLICTPWIGLADGPLVAYLTAGTLLIRRRNVLLGAILIGCGAMCKNEGVAFIAAIAVGMLTDRSLRSEIARLWPAIAIAAPWQIVRVIEHFPTDLTTGSIAGRITEHIGHPEVYLQLLRAGGRPLLWLGIALSAVVATRAWARERFLLVTASVQTLFYVTAYLVTPLDVGLHIRWSWDRLVSHIVPLIVFVALASALPIARSRQLVAVDQENHTSV